MLSDICRQIEDSIAVKQAVLRSSAVLGGLERLTEACLAALRAGGKIIFAGNGGSFADAQHLSAEFTSRFQFDRAPLASLTLATNNSTISAIGNDYGRSEEHTSELQSLMRISYAVFCLKKKKKHKNIIIEMNKT